MNPIIHIFVVFVSYIQIHSPSSSVDVKKEWSCNSSLHMYRQAWTRINLPLPFTLFSDTDSVCFTRDTNCDTLTKEKVQMGYNSAMF